MLHLAVQLSGNENSHNGFLTLSSASLLALDDSGDAVALHRRSISPIKNPDTDIETYHLAKLKSLKIGEKTFNDLPVGVYRIDDGTLHRDHRLAGKSALLDTDRGSRNEAQYTDFRTDLRAFRWGDEGGIDL